MLISIWANQDRKGGRGNGEGEMEKDLESDQERERENEWGWDKERERRKWVLAKGRSPQWLLLSMHKVGIMIPMARLSGTLRLNSWLRWWAYWLILIVNLIGFKLTMETLFGVHLWVCFQEGLIEEKRTTPHNCVWDYLTGWGPGLNK